MSLLAELRGNIFGGNTTNISLLTELEQRRARETRGLRIWLPFSWAWLSLLSVVRAMPIFSNKKKIATERDFPAGGKVSVWIGDFDDEMELLNYVEADEGFGADFGCVLRYRRELSVERMPKPLRHLLDGFSRSSQFVDEIVQQAGENVEARCVVVSYASDYLQLGVVPSPGARMRFVGVASFVEKS